MKKLVQVQDVKGEGLLSLLGEKVLLLCSNYFYTGTLTGVNTRDVLLEDASIVYETGNWSEKTWKDSQKVAEKLYVRISSIESYCKGK